MAWWDKEKKAKKKDKYDDYDGGWSSDDYYDTYYSNRSSGKNINTGKTGGGSRDYGYSYGLGYSGGNTTKRSTGFSWGSWGWDDDTDVDEDKLESFVSSHESYMTPKNTSIKIKEFSQDTEANRTFIKEMARFFYHKMIQNKGYIHDKYADESILTEKQIAHLNQKKGFYEALWDKEVPGFSPLEKAQLLFNSMVDKNKEEPGKNLADVEKLEDVLDEVHYNQELYSDPEFNELMDVNEYSKKNKYRIFELLSYIKNLGSEFKIEKEIEEKIVPNSHLIAKKILRDYDQIYRMDLYQRIFPTYRLNLIQKNIIINAPIEKTEHKQKIIYLLDFSGSMSRPSKQDWVVALLMDRLRFAMKDECELYFSYFVDKTSDLHFHHIYNKKTALDFWSTFSTRPNGGTTRIGTMVNYVHNEITTKKKLHNLNIDLSEDKPEILIMNDGQDYVDTKDFPYKTNAITLIDSENPGLKDLCIGTGGKYIYINDEEIRKYSKNTVLTEHIK